HTRFSRDWSSDVCSSDLYSIHRQALDNMYKQPAESQMVILSSINTLSQLQKENPGSMLLQFFFNAKSDEFASVVAQQAEANRPRSEERRVGKEGRYRW